MSDSKRSASLDDVALGERIRLSRVGKGLTQSDLGRVLNVSYQQVQKYERGLNRISGARLMRLAQALDADPNSLLGIEQPSTSAVRHHMSSNLGVALAKLFSKLNLQQQRELVELAKTMAKRR